MGGFKEAEGEHMKLFTKISPRKGDRTSVLVFQDNDKIINLWAGEHEDIMEYDCGGNQRESYFKTKKFHEAQPVIIKRVSRGDYKKELYRILEMYYCRLRNDYPHKMFDYYEFIYKHMLDRNIEEESGVVSLIDACLENDSQIVEKKISYLMKSYKYDYKIKDVQAKIWDMENKERWMHIKYIKVNV